ncbi:MAG: AAA family ATPase [Syntrophomonadaceae bacterium]|nr:AAA family ATPase [Syntrophomonadaceae bacterium]
MIAGITIKNFKGIKFIDRLPLGRFHVLVGPNASGKSTFLDVMNFIRDCLVYGPRKAVEKRVPDFRDLTFMRQGGVIEVELWLDMGKILASQRDNFLMYRLAIREDSQLGVCIEDEILKQYSKSWVQAGKKFEFSSKVTPRRLLGKTSKGNDFYLRESGKYQDNFTFGLDKPALSFTPPDEKRYPTANVVKNFLMQGIQYIQLNSRAMSQPCLATSPVELELDGSNLARVVGYLRGENNGVPEAGIRNNRFESLERWTDHLRYAIEDIEEVGWSKREPDNAEYIVLKYSNDFECPNWLLSDGTLRMLALTLLAFLPPKPGIYMVEEPENGVHPRALEIIIRSLSAVPGAQMLVATHSPLVVQQVGGDALLIFKRDEEGTHIVSGNNHPALVNMDSSLDIATIFASGVLG